jgi:hypothetical protein
MELIDYLHIITAFLFGVAALHKLYGKQAEHFYTRIVASAWFFMTFVFRDYLPIQWVRELSNYVIMTVPLVEIVSPMFIRYWKNKK